MAIIPIFSKILEKIVFNQVVEYLATNNLIHPNHHAYRADHNTTTALIQLYDIWLEAIENDKLAGVFFLDMSVCQQMMQEDKTKWLDLLIIINNYNN